MRASMYCAGTISPALVFTIALTLVCVPSGGCIELLGGSSATSTHEPCFTPKQGSCVDVALDPPSNSMQPPLGTQTKVKAMVKTKAGEMVPAQYIEARIYAASNSNVDAGFVSPSGGKSDVGSP